MKFCTISSNIKFHAKLFKDEKDIKKIHNTHPLIDQVGLANAREEREPKMSMSPDQE